MKELTIENLAKHLPYGLKFKHTFGQITTLIGFIYEPQQDWHCYQMKENPKNKFSLPNANKPILHPLSDLTKEIEHNGDKFVPIEKLRELFVTNIDCDCDINEIWNVWLDQKSEAYLNILAISSIKDKLIEWHFDIDQLIKKGLAIDVNTLETNPYK